MKSRIKPVLWTCLIVTALLMIPSVQMRYLNEKINNSVLFAADYSAFYTEWNRAGNSSPDHLLEVLKASSISTLVLSASVEQDSGKVCGFDPLLIEKLCSRGFDVMLHLSGNSLSSEDMKNLDFLLHQYGIKTVILDGDTRNRESAAVSGLADVLNKNRVIGILVENLEQTGYVEFPGFHELIRRTGYAVNRAYIVPDADFSSLSDEDLLFRWLRGVVDRSIRVIYVKPFISPERSHMQNVDHALSTVSTLQQLLLTKGYRINQPLPRPNIYLQNTGLYWIFLLNLTVAAALYSIYLHRFLVKKIWLILLLGLIAIPFLLSCFFTGVSMAAALGASILYPSLASLLFLNYLKYTPSHSYLQRLTVSLGILLAIMAAGALVVTAAMSDIRYTLLLINFNGALVTYVVPLAAFILNYHACFREVPSIAAFIKAYDKYIFSPAQAGLLLAGIAAGYIYLSRSGNHSLIPASYAELEMRKWLERSMTARPRIKEFIIGYPSLMGFILLHNRQTKPWLLFPLGSGTTIGLISVINSFCHGFTPVTVSLQRTANGFILGILCGMAALLSFTLLIKGIKGGYYSISSRDRKKLGIKLFIK